jgi:hypothetical protein
MNIVFRTIDTVQIFRFGTTSNDKIESDKKRKIVQSYTFSRKQYELVLNGNKGMKEFFNNADSNCLDCPYNEFGKCYTHKFNQYVGFISMLKSTSKKYASFDDIPFFDEIAHHQILYICKGTYVRFGTYGEPSLHPYELINDIVKVADNWTGYTHQWKKKINLSPFFMASTHTDAEDKEANFVGFRSFIATDEAIKGAVNCPASKEANYISTCSKCGLCSGTEGKGKKSVYIFNH